MKEKDDTHPRQKAGRLSRINSGEETTCAMTDAVHALQTLSGTAYAAMPLQANSPAPTLLLAMADLDTLTTEPYCRVGRLLHAQGWNVVSMDLPCHGGDRRPGGAAALVCPPSSIPLIFSLRLLRGEGVDEGNR